MNTQLASWSQLRHDNILYGKQSYTGGVTCSYPLVYVEPVPEFFAAIKNMAGNWKEALTSLNLLNSQQAVYIKNLSSYADTLYNISVKELNKTALTKAELNFLKSTLYKGFGTCGQPPYDGWFSKLFYSGWNEINMSTANRIVADLHTAPTDASGTPVGWVLHAGTGKPVMGFFIAPDQSGRDIGYAGPVMSYYEYLTSGFKRLTDEEWNLLLDGSFAPASPSFTDIYMTDSKGNYSSAKAISIATLVKDENSRTTAPSTYLAATNYPNPFNPSTIIRFSIPYSLKNKPAELIIYDIQGKEVRHLLKETLQEGNYLIKWDSKSDNGHNAASGIYLYRLSSGTQSVSGKMTLMK